MQDYFHWFHGVLDLRPRGSPCGRLVGNYLGQFIQICARLSILLRFALLLGYKMIIDFRLISLILVLSLPYTKYEIKRFDKFTVYVFECEKRKRTTQKAKNSNAPDNYR